MRRKQKIVFASLSAHVALVFGIYVAGLWHIEKLDARPPRTDIAVGPQLPPEGGAPSGQASQTITKKKSDRPKKKPDVPVQPDVPQTANEPTTVADVGDGSGSGSGSGDGSGSGSGSGDGDGSGSGSGSGACAQPPCGAPAQPPPVEQTHVVSPRALAALRISGETQIVPPDTVKSEILRDGRDVVRGSFKVCLAANGEVSGVTTVRSTGYPAYDARLLERMRTWRYRPFVVNDRGVPACGMVTFELEIH